MPTVPVIAPPHRLPSAGWRHLALRVAEAWRAQGMRRSRGRHAAVLLGLDDRTLQDLGLNRSEIEWIVRAGEAGRRPSRASIRRSPAEPARPGSPSHRAP